MLVIDRMSILICYKIIMGPMRFFVARAHSMLKPWSKECFLMIGVIRECLKMGVTVLAVIDSWII